MHTLCYSRVSIHIIAISLRSKTKCKNVAKFFMMKEYKRISLLLHVLYVYLCSCIILCVILPVSFMQS